jgi:outer membrane protein assembly factor BamB
MAKQLGDIAAGFYLGDPRSSAGKESKMKPFTASIAFFCLCALWCSIGHAHDETACTPLYDAAGNLIGTIDATGQLISETVRASDPPLAEPGYDLFSPPAMQRGVAAAELPAEVSPHTIDKINLASYYYESYSPSYGMIIGERVTTYQLSDGSSWSSGAGSASYGRMQFERMETDGSTLRFHFTHHDLFMRKTDYDSGSHSANFELHVDGPLVIVAQAGSQQGMLEGQALIVSDQPANYTDSRFNYLTAIPGSVVRFRISYGLRGAATFSSGLFDTSFTFTYSGIIDLTDVVYSPPLLDVALVGPPMVPEDAVVSYSALATFEPDIQRLVTADSQWSCSDPDVASFISPGKLQIGPVEQDTELTLYVACTDQGIEKSAQKTITVVDIDSATTDIGWPMYQANERHDGYLPVELEEGELTQLWQTTIGAGTALNRITAAAGKVFTSGKGKRIDVVDGHTGVVLWTELLGSYGHGSFPSYANGMVYFQTGNHGNDTWLRAYDAESGEQVFKVPHSAQWEDYYAPTLYDGKVYINGGYYGGAYCFDAYSGHQDWFIDLPQYDDWTPAVDEQYAYAYLGEYSPGLYVINRLTGSLAFEIPDPAFDWGGWSMNLAPVIGGRGNVLAIHDGRLINFDVGNRRIAYQIEQRFTGQVSVAKGSVYAINDGNIDIRDEATGNLLHTVDIPDSLYDAMIVTDSHIIARSQSKTYAIALDTMQVDWQCSLSGYMALSDDRLYIADSSGRLTAVSAPTVVPATPPVADAGEDQEVDAGSGCTAIAILNGSGSSDADGDELTYRWYYEGQLFDEGAEIEAELGLGDHVFTLIVNDGTYDSEPDEVFITVKDNMEPVVVLGAMLEIWPPNHKYHEFNLADFVVSAVDNCSDVLDVNAAGRIISIYSDEPEIGDDHTTKDIVIQGDGSFKVRAERQGKGNGRVYSVTFEIVDGAGNVTLATGYVGVPHDKSGKPPVNDLAGQ